MDKGRGGWRDDTVSTNGLPHISSGKLSKEPSERWVRSSYCRGVGKCWLYGRLNTHGVMDHSQLQTSEGLGQHLGNNSCVWQRTIPMRGQVAEAALRYLVRKSGEGEEHEGVLFWVTLNSDFQRNRRRLCQGSGGIVDYGCVRMAGSHGDFSINVSHLYLPLVW